MEIKITFGEILEKTGIYGWQYICNKYGIDEWCMNEGTADSETEISISLEVAKEIGLFYEDN